MLALEALPNFRDVILEGLRSSLLLALTITSVLTFVFCLYFCFEDSLVVDILSSD